MKRKTLISSLVAGVLGALSGTAFALDPLDDTSMADVTGQALFSSAYVAPGGTNPNTNIGFYRLGVSAQMELNANINRLALGCDGANGTGTCDIDISHVRLTGISGTSSGDTGPGTDFLINNPFLEFAVKNPTGTTTREIAGIRFGALSVLGAMSIGENANVSDLADDTGITTISGDMVARVTNATLTNVRACLGVLVLGACAGGWLTGSAVVSEHIQNVGGKRISTVDIGPMSAQASGSLLGLTLNNTWIPGLPLRAIHRIDVQDDSGNPTKDFSLSMQKQNLVWQKISDGSFSSVTAQTGWWMSLPRVQVANITSGDQISLSGLGSLAGAIFNTRVNIAPIDLGQRPVDNCFGSLGFC